MKGIALTSISCCIATSEVNFLFHIYTLATQCQQKEMSLTLYGFLSNKGCYIVKTAIHTVLAVKHNLILLPCAQSMCICLYVNIFVTNYQPFPFALKRRECDVRLLVHPGLNAILVSSFAHVCPIRVARVQGSD